MSDISLNIVAIAIFLVVMASLLGPLVNISPGMTAIAAFVLLSIATLDNFSGGGRLGTLLVDGIANLSAEHRQRVARHEAGHFLTAYLLEIPITGYTLTAWETLRQQQPGQGGVQVEQDGLTSLLSQEERSLFQLKHLLERYSTVWMAGIVAEELVYGDVEGGAGDRQLFREFWTQIQDTADLDQQERWSCLRAKTLLENHWAAYEALAKALEARSPLSECYAIIQTHLPDPISTQDRS